MKSVPHRADLMIVGDSLMTAWRADSLARAFPGTAVWNYGVGGDKTQSMLWRVYELERRDLRVSKIAIMAGTNNLADADMPTCAIAIGVETLVEKAHAIWPAATIYLMTVAPRGKDFAFRDADRRAINTQLDEWTRTAPYSRLVPLPEAELVCRGVVGTCPNYEADMLHFASPAYEIVGRTLRAAMSR